MVFAGPYSHLVHYVDMSPSILATQSSLTTTTASLPPLQPLLPSTTTDSSLLSDGKVNASSNDSSSISPATPTSSRVAIKLSPSELRAVLSSLVTEQEDNNNNEHKSMSDDKPKDETEEKPIAMYAAGLARATLSGNDGKLMTTEERSRGTVGWEVWGRYIQAIGGWRVAIAIGFLLSVLNHHRCIIIFIHCIMTMA